MARKYGNCEQVKAKEQNADKLQYKNNVLAAIKGMFNFLTRCTPCGRLLLSLIFKKKEGQKAWGVVSTAIDKNLNIKRRKKIYRGFKQQIFRNEEFAKGFILFYIILLLKRNARNIIL